MKIIGIGRVKKKISQAIGAYKKSRFNRTIYKNPCNNLFSKYVQSDNVEIELVTFVNSASFSDLVLTILSFMNEVGKPRKWTLYTDDMFTQQQKILLDKLPFIFLQPWDVSLHDENKSKYSKKWQLRKFSAYAFHSINGTTLFIDSDVLFYPLFRKYMTVFKEGNWYLPEPPEANNIDLELTESFEFKKEMYLVNAGFFIINESPDWIKGFEYLDYCCERNKEHYFLDQTALNLIYYIDKNANILDPRVFHASANDHFQITALATDQFAIRHYVGLIRHKMWQLGWKKYLN